MKKKKKYNPSFILKISDTKIPDEFNVKKFNRKIDHALKKRDLVGREKLRSDNYKKKRTVSEKEKRYSIYTGSFFTINARSEGRRKPATLETIYLIDRIETKSGSCIAISVEEWNGRVNTRTLCKRIFYRDHDGNWQPGKSYGLTYIDLEQILKPTPSAEKLRNKILPLLYGPTE